VIAPSLVRDLSTEMSRYLTEESGPLAEAPEIHQQLVRCYHTDRRRELERFVQNVDDELSVAARRDFAIAMHPVQVDSKLWLIDELARCRDLALSSLVVLGSWYGILPLLINWRIARPPHQMVCIDYDSKVCETGARMIGSLYANIEYRCANAIELDYSALGTKHSPIVINTICEHLPEFADWWAAVPHGQLVVLQSNNYTLCPDHVNCVQNLDELKKQAPMSEVLFEGALPVLKWKRFMLIGRR